MNVQISKNLQNSITVEQVERALIASDIRVAAFDKFKVVNLKGDTLRELVINGYLKDSGKYVILRVNLS